MTRSEQVKHAELSQLLERLGGLRVIQVIPCAWSYNHDRNYNANYMGSCTFDPLDSAFVTEYMVIYETNN